MTEIELAHKAALDYYKAERSRIIEAKKDFKPDDAATLVAVRMLAYLNDIIILLELCHKQQTLMEEYIREVKNKTPL